MPLVILWGHPKCTALDWRKCLIVQLWYWRSWYNMERTGGQWFIFMREGNSSSPWHSLCISSDYTTTPKTNFKGTWSKIRFMFQLAYSSAYDKHWIPFLDAVFKGYFPCVKKHFYIWYLTLNIPWSQNSMTHLWSLRMIRSCDDMENSLQVVSILSYFLWC